MSTEPTIGAGTDSCLGGRDRRLGGGACGRAGCGGGGLGWSPAAVRGRVGWSAGAVCGGAWLVPPAAATARGLAVCVPPGRRGGPGRPLPLPGLLLAS